MLKLINSFLLLAIAVSAHAQSTSGDCSPIFIESIGSTVNCGASLDEITAAREKLEQFLDLRRIANFRNGPRIRTLTVDQNCFRDGCEEIHRFGVTAFLNGYSPISAFEFKYNIIVVDKHGKATRREGRKEYFDGFMHIHIPVKDEVDVFACTMFRPEGEVFYVYEVSIWEWNPLSKILIKSVPTAPHFPATEDACSNFIADEAVATRPFGSITQNSGDNCLEDGELESMKTSLINRDECTFRRAIYRNGPKLNHVEPSEIQRSSSPVNDPALYMVVNNLSEVNTDFFSFRVFTTEETIFSAVSEQVSFFQPYTAPIDPLPPYVESCSIYRPFGETRYYFEKVSWARKDNIIYEKSSQSSGFTDDRSECLDVK